jgi:phosphoglycolate phosphatase
MKKLILFDLDGTLTDSAPGITRSVQYALEKMGYPRISETELRTFIGPPLNIHFCDFIGMSEEEAALAVKHFRERFSVKGIFENSLYEGVSDMLDRLKEAGAALGLATSKPDVFAEKIAEHLGFASKLDVLSAASLDETKDNKPAIIDQAIRRAGFDGRREDVIMVGDRKYDICGAHENGVFALGVTYGYGSAAELAEAGADAMADTTGQLTAFLADILAAADVREVEG